MKTTQTVDSNDETLPPPGGTMSARLRLPLATMGDVKRELGRLYRDGKSGRRDVSDVSRLANVLGILARLIEASSFEQRLSNLEKRNGNC
jgi:hypothetical protein